MAARLSGAWYMMAWTGSPYCHTARARLTRPGSPATTWRTLHHARSAICLSRDPSQSSAVGPAAVVGRVTACDACPPPVGTVAVFSGTSSLAAGRVGMVGPNVNRWGRMPQALAASLDDPQHFSAIVDRHFREIFRYVARRVGREEADDLVAETFATAFGKRKNYDLDHPDALPWLYGIATDLSSPPAFGAAKTCAHMPEPRSLRWTRTKRTRSFDTSMLLRNWPSWLSPCLRLTPTTETPSISSPSVD